MSWFKVKNFVRFYLIAFFASFFFLCFTFLAFWEVYERVNERNENLFRFRAGNAKAAIEKRIYDYIQILKGSQGLFAASDSVNHQEYKNYIDNLEVDVNYPGILGIGFAPYIENEELEPFERKVRKEKYADFNVWPDGKRLFYTPILFLEPLNFRNSRAIGFDMFSDSVRREAMEKAMDTGKPALTGIVKLVQETNVGVQNGFLLYLPVYDKSTKVPETTEERRASLTGFTYSPFRVNDLMNGILGRQYQELDIEIYDGSQINENTLLFDRYPERSYGSEERLSTLYSIQLGGRTWQIFLSAGPDFGYETSFPWFILAGGMVVSILIFMIMYSVANFRKSNYLNQLITDNATPALLILDSKGYCTFANPAAEVLTGYTYGEMHNHLLHNLFHSKKPDGRVYPINDCPIVRALQTKNSLFKHEDVFVKKSGEFFDVSLNTQPIYESGKVVAHLMEVRDITQEKKAEAAAKEKNRNLQTLNHIGKNLSAELDLKKLLQLVTDSCTELTGAEFGAFFYNQKNQMGEPVRLYTLSGENIDSFPDFLLPEKTAVFSTFLTGKQALRFADISKDPQFGNHNPFNKKPESRLPVKSFLSVPVILRSGEVSGALFFGHTQAGIFTVGSEEIVKGIASQAAVAIDNSQLFEAMNANNKELIRINNDLDNFVYTASHDLKAPVLNIEGLINALALVLKKNDPEKAEKIIQMMALSVTKFKDTIESLTEVSKINKNLDAEAEPLILSELLEDVKFSIQDMIKESGTIIEDHIQCQELIFSKPNMKSLLLNLLTNSIKYSSPDRPPVVKTGCTKEDGKFIITVSDNGLGIPENQLPKIFTMFRRYHSHVEGTGVGLYLVKRIAENYGGSVEVESVVDRGTTFTIKLPELQSGDFTR